MINKILTTIAISAFSLTTLAACGSGGSSNNNNPITGAKISVTVLPQESGGSKGPGIFTPNSCTGINESSLCSIKVTWSNLPSPSIVNGYFSQLSSTLANSGLQFSISTLDCTADMNESQNGSCVVNYDYRPQESGALPYESSAVFTVIFGTSNGSNTTIATSNSILIRASESSNPTK